MADLSSNVYVQGTLTALSYVGYPIGYLLYGIALTLLFIGKLLYGPVITFLQPFIFIGRLVLYLILLPYNLLVSFEPLYNFLGVAAIMGILIGLGLYYSAQKFEDVPDLSSILDTYIEEYVPWLSQKRTIKEYRKSKAKAASGHVSLPTSGYASLSDTYQPSVRGKRGMLAQTILEEGDSDF